MKMSARDINGTYLRGDYKSESNNLVCKFGTARKYMYVGLKEKKKMPSKVDLQL